MEQSKYATTSSTLAATAPPAPASDYVAPESSHLIPEPPLDETDLGEFAQTRPPDDLFADDFTPLAEPVVEPASPFVPPSDDGESASTTTVPLRSQSNHVPPTLRSFAMRKSPSKTTGNGPMPPRSPKDSANASGSKTMTHAQAVRGDRSTTGGITKSKLTEDELNAKMEAIKLKNTALEEAHARQKADEESFQASEAAAEHRQKQERLDRQAMLNEREKIAQRKMKALGGRDWDASKDEAAIVDRPHRRPMRGAHGGVVKDVHTQSAPTQNEDVQDVTNNESYSGRGRLRGSRGRNRTNGRGGRQGTKLSRPNDPTQTVPTAQDFPTLQPTGEALSEGKPSVKAANKIDTSDGHDRPAPSRVDSLGVIVTPGGESKSWAEQMNE